MYCRIRMDADNGIAEGGWHSKGERGGCMCACRVETKEAAKEIPIDDIVVTLVRREAS